MKSQFSLVALFLSLALCRDSRLAVPVYSSFQAPGDPRPSNAVEAIVKAFDKFPLVAFGERHLLQEGADFEEILSILEQRDPHYAKVVEDEVLAKGRKALLIAGDGHFARQSIRPMDHTGRLIEKRRPKSLFVIISHLDFLERNEELEPRLASWPKPSLAILKGTWLGALDASLTMRILKSRDGGKCIYNPYGETLLEDAADAYLYLGHSDSLTISLPSPDIFRDEVYVKELKRRFKILGQDFDPAPHLAFLMRKSSKKFDIRLPIKPQKKCP